MKFKKTICALAMAMAVGGCQTKNYHYEFNGEIDGEKIEFITHSVIGGSDTNYLYTVRSDGTLMIYSDSDNDDKIESVCITPPESEKKCFYNDVIGGEALAEAQNQYDRYLNKILKHKQKEAIRIVEGNVSDVKGDIKE